MRTLVGMIILIKKLKSIKIDDSSDIYWHTVCKIHLKESELSGNSK